MRLFTSNVRLQLRRWIKHCAIHFRADSCESITPPTCWVPSHRRIAVASIFYCFVVVCTNDPVVQDKHLLLHKVKEADCRKTATKFSSASARQFNSIRASIPVGRFRDLNDLVHIHIHIHIHIKFKTRANDYIKVQTDKANIHRHYGVHRAIKHNRLRVTNAIIISYLTLSQKLYLAVFNILFIGTVAAGRPLLSFRAKCHSVRQLKRSVILATYRVGNMPL